MRTTEAILIGLTAGGAAGWVGHGLTSRGGDADPVVESRDHDDAPVEGPGLAAGRTGGRAPISRKDVLDAARRFDRAKTDGATVGPKSLVALATLEAVGGDEAEFLRLAERALASGLSIDDLLDALAEFPADRRAALLSTLLERHPDAVSDSVAVARAFAGAGRPDKALALVRAALPRASGLQPELARMLIQLDPEGAARSLFALEGSETWGADSLDVLRSLFIEADQESRLTPFLERVLDAHPGDHAALRSLRKVDPAAADVRLRALLVKNPDDPTAWSLLGELRHDAGDAAGAFDAFRKAAERDPRRSTFRDLVDADPVRGLEVVAALAKDSSDDEMLGALGQMYARVGRKDEAVKALLAAHEHDPKDMEWIDRLIELDPSAALSAVERRVGDAPGAARDDLLGRYGDALRAVGRTSDAFQQYVAAARRRPDADAWQQAMVETDPKAALPILEAHIKERPNDSSGHGNYGVALASTGRTADAIVQLERALADGEPHRWYEELRKLDPARALDGLERRSRTDPGNDRVFGLLGQELHAQHRDAEAKAAYQRAAQLDPSDRDWARAIRELK